jgi:hypothetical protein
VEWGDGVDSCDSCDSMFGSSRLSGRVVPDDAGRTVGADVHMVVL